MIESLHLEFFSIMKKFLSLECNKYMYIKIFQCRLLRFVPSESEEEKKMEFWPLDYYLPTIIVGSNLLC